MRSPAANRPSPARRSTARPAVPSADRPPSRRWPSAITIIARCGRRRPGRARNERRRQDHRRDPGDRHRLEAAQVRHRAHGWADRRGARRLWRGQARREHRNEAAQMTILLIIAVAVVLAFLAFKFVSGMIKFAVLAVVVILALFIAHQAGAF